MSERCGCNSGLFGGDFIWWIIIIVVILCVCPGIFDGCGKNCKC